MALLACLACGLLLALGAVSAHAAVERPFKTFPSDPVDSPLGVATDNSGGLFAGDLYVLGQGGAAQLARFRASGEPDPSFATSVSFVSPGDVAVDSSSSPSAGDIYVADGGTTFGAGRVDKVSPSGALLARLDATSFPPATPGSASFAPGGIAVDPADGNLFVADRANGYVDVFDPLGVFVRQFASTNPSFVVVDSTHDAYVANFNGRVNKYLASNDYSTPTLITNGSQLASDPTTGELYVKQALDSSTREIAKYSSAGLLLERFGSAELTSSALGISVNAAADTVYVAIASQDQVGFFGPPVLLPDVETLPASSVGPSTATLNGTLGASSTDSADALTECKFEYGTTQAYGQTAECVPGFASIPTDESDHPVSADIAALQPGTTYHFRLVASNDNGSKPGHDEQFSTPPPPAVASMLVSDVSAREATLKARINPRGYATDYHFEYIADDAYQANLEAGEAAFTGAARAPADAEGIGAGTAEVAVAQHVTGLQPDTVYHLRVVAANENGTTILERTVTTFALPTGSLPDGRAYELVSSGDMSTGDAREDIQLAVDAGGERLALHFANAAGPISGVGSANAVLASRTASGWATDSVALPNGPPVSAFSNDLVSGRIYVTQDALTPADTNGAADIYLRRGDGSLVWLTATAIDGGIYPGVRPYRLISSVRPSDDFSRVFFQSNQQLTPEAPPSPDGEILYAADVGDGSLTYVGILPGGAPATSSALNYPGGSIEHGVSPDGSSAVFLAPAPANHVDQHSVYLWRSGEPTVEVSASQRSSPDPNGPQPADYKGASRDQSQIFFTSSEKLTDDATTGPTDSRTDLYRYDTASGGLADLSVDTSDTDGADVRGVAAISNDGSYVYFVAHGSLAPGAVSGPGQFNLYLRHDGATTFIAALNEHDGDVYRAAGNDRVVMPNGSQFLFASRAKLTGYDNAEHVGLYLYDAGADHLSCVSCNPSGERPLGDASLPASRNWALNFPGHVNGEPGVARSITADGSRVFFTSTDRLAGRAVNGRQNVYEWVKDGSHDCSRSSGCIYLLSDGTGRYDSVFANASADGSHVFFTTGDQLLPADVDTNIDLYDAHEGGGFPAPPPIAAPCSGVDCRASAGSAQTILPLASASLRGRGNLRAHRDCSSLGERARNFSQRAKRRARNFSQRAKRCRRVNRRAGK